MTTRRSFRLSPRLAARTASHNLIAIAFASILLLGSGCGGEKPKNVRDPVLDQKIERLLTLILEVEQLGAATDDSLSVAANALIAELGGEDSVASLLASRLLENAERWVPLLDSLARVSTGAAAIAPNSP